MGKKSKAWLKAVSQDKSMAEAKQLDTLLEELDFELLSFLEYLRIFSQTCKYRYPKHTRVRNTLKRFHDQLWKNALSLANLRKDYHRRIADYEHENGTLDVKKPRHLADFSVSIHELLDEMKEDELIGDFLDG